MNDDETMRLAERFADALHGLDRDANALDAMVELFAEGAELTNAALALTGESHRGREGAREFWRHYRDQLDEAETEFHQITRSEEAAGLFWTTRGKALGGEPIEYRGATLLVFDGDGLVERFHGYYDTRQLTVHESGSA